MSLQRSYRAVSSAADTVRVPHLPMPASVLDALPDAVYVVDRDRTVTYWNPAAEEISGYTDREMVGHWCGADLLNHVDEDGQSLCGSRCPLQATLDDGLTREARVLMHHRDGHLVPIAVRAAPLRDETGAIVAAVETFRDDTAHSVERDRVRELEVVAASDPLTGIGNRRALEAHLLDRFAALRHRGVQFGVLMLDLDRFKTLNDTCGHAAGDQAIKVVARTVQHCLPGRGRVFRYGGDELVVLVPPCDLATLAVRLCAYVEESRLALGDETLHVTVSIGGTMAVAGEDFSDVLRRADRLMYEAKRSGGNCGVTDVPLEAGSLGDVSR